jgi:arylsulfatase A-like enzyme
MDIHPTAAAAADAPVSHGEPLDGVNLLPYLTNEKEGDPHDILFWHRDSENAARSGDFKLIGHDKVGWRLYNLVDDIGETHDLSKEDPDTVRRLRKALDAWRAELTEPQWDESKQWADVKFEFYRAWLDNEQPRYTNPRQLESWRRKNPGSR